MILIKKYYGHLNHVRKFPMFFISNGVKSHLFPDSQTCACPVVFDFVCGIDGVTYNSICHAKCNGVSDFKCAKSCDKCDSTCDKPWITHL